MFRYFLKCLKRYENAIVHTWNRRLNIRAVTNGPGCSRISFSKSSTWQLKLAPGWSMWFQASWVLSESFETCEGQKWIWMHWCVSGSEWALPVPFFPSFFRALLYKTEFQKQNQAHRAKMPNQRKAAAIKMSFFTVRGVFSVTSATSRIFFFSWKTSKELFVAKNKTSLALNSLVITFADNTNMVFCSWKLPLHKFADGGFSLLMWGGIEDSIMSLTSTTGGPLLPLDQAEDCKIFLSSLDWTIPCVFQKHKWQ